MLLMPDGRFVIAGDVLLYGSLGPPDLPGGLKTPKSHRAFTRPEGTLAHLRVCRELGVNMIIGTTGFTAEQKAEIDDAARDIAIVMAPNMAVGVNVVAPPAALRSTLCWLLAESLVRCGYKSDGCIRAQFARGVY